VSSRPSSFPHIGFYVHGMLFSKGGIERQCALLSNTLTERGYKVTIFCRVWSSSAPAFDVSPSVAVVPVFDETKIEVSKKNLRTQVVRSGVDIFIPMLSEALFEPIIDSVEGLNVFVIASEHNDPWVIERLWWSKKNRDMYFRKVDSIHLLSSFFKSSLENDLHDRIRVIPNGVRAPHAYTKSERGIYRFIALGRLVPQKRFDILIRAVSVLLADRRDFIVEVFGAGPLDSSLRELASDLKVTKNIQFRGITNRVYEELQASTALVMSSEFEGFGIVVAEAKISGVPSLAFKTCNGPNWLIRHEVDGLLCNFDETGKSLALAMLRLMNEPKSIAAMREKAFEDGQRFKIDDIATQWEKLFLEIQIKHKTGITSSYIPHKSEVQSLLS
jgi:glycosyltransferase involved in cell wall biosynthesis